MSLRPPLSSRPEFPLVERTHEAALLFFSYVQTFFIFTPKLHYISYKKHWVNLNEIILKAEKSEEGWVG